MKQNKFDPENLQYTLQSVFSKVNEEQNLQISEHQMGQYVAYFRQLLLVNEYMNLTAITQPEEVAELHLFDSLTPLPYLPIKEEFKIIDVGTGAGLPGIPLKIMHPEIQLTLLDSTKKRLNFLAECLSLLNLEPKTELLHARAEEAGRNQKYREQYDCAIARAVAALPVLAEYCLPFVKLNGLFIALKGKITEELKESERAITLLGGEISEVISLQLPYSRAERNLIIIKKIKSTPVRYPRSAAKIKQKPLSS